MKALLASEVRKHWTHVLHEVTDDLETVLIPLRGGKGVVMMSQDRYESLLATLEVMSDPEAVRAIRQHKAGKGKTYTLADIDKVMRAGNRRRRDVYD